jgi:NAD(P)-dependent dehydrogenase (short-subunit alcohol dehydrogenase family)
MRLDGRTALITGAGSGIGRATALLFAAEGARVFLVGRREAPLREVAEAVASSGGEAHLRTADVRDDGEVRAAVAEAVEKLGGLDALVNNAGLAPSWTPVHETPDAAWDEVLDVNLTGAFRVARAALPHLVARRGSLVNVSSVSAVKAMNSVASYSAAKAGLLALTRCIAAEYGWQGVRCNCVVPSWVDTPMTTGFLADDSARREVGGRHMLQRVAEPEEVARAILFLASGEGSFVTGTALAVDGGMAAL